MAINGVRRLWAFCAALLFCAPFFLFSQDAPEPDQLLDVTPNAAPLDPAGGVYSYVRNDRGESTFVQHISWQGANYVRRYEVIVEQETNGAEGVFEQIFKESTREIFVELSLTGGRYRYKIIAYDLLMRPGSFTEWRYLTVITILKPEITGFVPIQILLDESAQYRVVVTGRNFFSTAQVFLRERSNGNIIEPALVQVDTNFQTLVLTFDTGQLAAGNYEIHIVNPGSLEASSETFTVKLPPRGQLLTASAGYAPIIPFQSGQFFSFFNQSFVPVGAYMRFNTLPANFSWGNLGGEIAAFWNYLSHETTDIQMQSHILTARVSALVQKPLPNETMFVNVRIGAGIISLLDFRYSYQQYTSEPFFGMYFSAGAEASFQWFPFTASKILKPLFMESGIGFTHAFTSDDSMQIDYLTFFLGIGAKF
jgi:hypothetical protein